VRFRDAQFATAQQEAEMRLAYLVAGVAVIVPGSIVMPTAAADCTSAAGTTVCSQGDVRGANTGQGPGVTTPSYPYQCWYCDDGGLTFVFVRPDRPDRPDRPHGDRGR